MILFSKQEMKITSTSDVGKPLEKEWKGLGNGIEILVNTAPEIQEKEGKKEDKKKKGIQVKDLVLYQDKWAEVQEIKTNEENKQILTCKLGSGNIDLPIEEAIKYIELQILVYSPSQTSIKRVYTHGRKKLNTLAKQFTASSKNPDSQFTWYYKGKQLGKDDSVETAGLVAESKLFLIITEMTIKTFKRFPRFDENGGWYMSSGSPDAITFVPSKAVKIYGFGMYYPSQGSDSYNIKYSVWIDGTLVKEEQLTITRDNKEEKVHKLFFSQRKENYLAAADSKIEISVIYPQYDDNTRLMVGRDGSKYDTIEENEQGIFKIERCSKSQNGTDVGDGQIPEIYYSA